VFYHVIEDANVHSIYSELPCSSMCLPWLAK
jgi:hypothetical protein